MTLGAVRNDTEAKGARFDTSRRIEMPKRKEGALALRSRGGQPGNTNALKHGFYAEGFHINEVEDMDAYFHGGNLDDEIAMLRITARRLFLMAKDEVTLEEMIPITKTLAAICTRLGGMLRLRMLINSSENSSVEKTIQQALNDVLSDLAPGLTKGIVLLFGLLKSY